MKDTLPDPAVMGRILLLQSAMASVSDEPRLVEMVVHGLSKLPGVGGILVCIEGGRIIVMDGLLLPESCRLAIANGGPPCGCPSGCSTQSGGMQWRHTLQIGGHVYGLLGMRISKEDEFRAIEPFIANTANLLALQIENRRQSMELQALNRSLEQLVGVRTASLRESESKYRTLVETLPQRIFVKDVHSVYISCNAQYASGLGIAPEAIVGKDDYAFHPKELADQYRADDQSVMESGVTREIEERYVQDGKTHCAISTKTPMRDNEGRVSGVLGVFTDITERKRAEESMRQATIKIKAILDSVSDAFFSMDEHLNVTYFNPAAERLLHRDSSEVVGKYLFDAFPEARGSIFDEKYHQAVKEKVFLSFDTYFDVAPYCNWYEVRIYPQPEGISVYFQVITERKRAEEALRESENKHSALFESMTEMVALHELVLDDTGNPINYRITDCNKAYVNITGIKREFAIGRTATEVYATEKPPYFAEFAHVAITGEPHVFETFFPPMGKYFSISVVSPGKKKFATISTDITAIKQAEQIIANKNRDLEQIIYVASHDLRSPLVNIDGYGRELEYAVAGIAGVLDGGDDVGKDRIKEALRTALPEMTDALRHIRNSTKQMDALLKGLLKLSRFGRKALKICPLDMNNITARVVASLEFQARQAGAVITIGELPPCKGDEVQIIQVFSNLVSNALKFLDPNRPGIIKINGAVEHSRALYCVEDNGVGIAPEHQEKIFELFHRLDPSKSEGEGLGLTIVRQILGRFDGEIMVQSKPGEGSRFLVTLPHGKMQSQNMKGMET